MVRSIWWIGGAKTDGTAMAAGKRSALRSDGTSSVPDHSAATTRTRRRHLDYQRRKNGSATHHGATFDHLGPPMVGQPGQRIHREEKPRRFQQRREAQNRWLRLFQERRDQQWIADTLGNVSREHIIRDTRALRMRVSVAWEAPDARWAHTEASSNFATGSGAVCRPIGSFQFVVQEPARQRRCSRILLLQQCM